MWQRCIGQIDKSQSPPAFLGLDYEGIRCAIEHLLPCSNLHVRSNLCASVGLSLLSDAALARGSQALSVLHKAQSKPWGTVFNNRYAIKVPQLARLIKVETSNSLEAWLGCEAHNSPHAHTHSMMTYTLNQVPPV